MRQYQNCGRYAESLWVANIEQLTGNRMQPGVLLQTHRIKVSQRTTLLCSGKGQKCLQTFVLHIVSYYLFRSSISPGIWIVRKSCRVRIRTDFDIFFTNVTTPLYSLCCTFAQSHRVHAPAGCKPACAETDKNGYGREVAARLADWCRLHLLLSCNNIRDTIRLAQIPSTLQYRIHFMYCGSNLSQHSTKELESSARLLWTHHVLLFYEV